MKHDGFRAVAYIENGLCKLVSRNDFNYTRFQDVALRLPSAINATNAILDGELVVLDRTGKARFNDLMAGRGYVVFATFDLMWLNGRDLRDQPLWGRKELLRLHLESSSRVLYVDHVEGNGKRLYSHICKRDLEGIVCKPNYSQAERRRELFNKRRT